MSLPPSVCLSACQLAPKWVASREKTSRGLADKLARACFNCTLEPRRRVYNIVVIFFLRFPSLLPLCPHFLPFPSDERSQFVRERRRKSVGATRLGPLRNPRIPSGARERALYREMGRSWPSVLIAAAFQARGSEKSSISAMIHLLSRNTAEWDNELSKSKFVRPLVHPRRKEAEEMSLLLWFCYIRFKS